MSIEVMLFLEGTNKLLNSEFNRGLKARSVERLDSINDAWDELLRLRGEVKE